MAIDLLAWVPCPSAPARWDSRACSRAASRASARSVSLSHADPVRCLVKTRSSVLSPLSSVPGSRCSLFLSLFSNGMTEKQHSVSRSRLWASRARSVVSLPLCDSRSRWMSGSGGLASRREVWLAPNFVCISLCEAERLGSVSASCPRCWNRMWHTARVGNSTGMSERRKSGTELIGRTLSGV